MKHITLFLDFISPYAYLAFERAPTLLSATPHTLTYKPILFASLLKAHGNIGPAEIEHKREWMARQVLWQAHQQHTPCAFPKEHPFNPLQLLRLAIACGDAGTGALSGSVSREVCQAVFRHVWATQGQSALDPARIAALTAQVRPRHDASAEAVKDALRRNSDEALGAGVFGVPSFVVDGRVFWGNDALPMLSDYLQGGDWFTQKPGEWDSLKEVQFGVRRRELGK